jgi:NAD(P)-dependent dehydrogenase (short-subunit alcohol dehydrogenase family)
MRRVLVTGGGSGAGAAIALAFAAAGDAVVICGRRPAPLEAMAARHPAISPVLADVSDEASVEALFAEAGRCDVVIANAGQADSAPLAKTSLAEWNALLAVNLTGTVLTFRAGLRQFEGWGRLIAVASTAGLKRYAKVAPYAAAKHGVIWRVKSVALEVARGPVTCNALCPGFLDTEMTAQSIRTIVEKTGRSPPEARAALEAISPQRRLYQPEDLASAALRLCAPGSEGVNGQGIAISGGET